MQHSERHDRNLEIDPLWYTQPMKNCESVGDVVIAAIYISIYIAAPHVSVFIGKF